MSLLDTLQQFAMDDRFAGVGIDRKNGVVTQGGESVLLAGARATVETSGQIDKRVTATRFILTGPLAFAIRKKKDNRQLYLTVEGEAGVLFAEVRPQREKDARKFAARLNSAAKQAPRAASTPEGA